MIGVGSTRMRVDLHVLHRGNVGGALRLLMDARCAEVVQGAHSYRGTFVRLRLQPAKTRRRHGLSA